MRHRSVAQCAPCSILRRAAGRPCLPAQPLKSRVSSRVAWQDVDREARVGQNRETTVSRGWHGSRHLAARPRGVVIISQAVQPLLSVRRGRARGMRARSDQNFSPVRRPPGGNKDITRRSNHKHTTRVHRSIGHTVTQYSTRDRSQGLNCSDTVSRNVLKQNYYSEVVVVLVVVLVE